MNIFNLTFQEDGDSTELNKRNRRNSAGKEEEMLIIPEKEEYESPTPSDFKSISVLN